MTNPYDAPRTDSAGPSTLNEPRRPSKVRRTIGLILLVVSLMSLRGFQRPTGSTGSILDDLPFLGGQLFVSAAIAAVGLFLLFKKPAGNAKRVD